MFEILWEKQTTKEERDGVVKNTQFIKLKVWGRNWGAEKEVCWGNETE
jgi:hypothetical protein